MSSEMPRFVLSSLTASSSPGRCRLHSRSFTLFSRSFALLLLASACQVLAYDLDGAAQRSPLWTIVECTLHLAALLALAWYAWARSKPVFATPAGLEVGAGKKLRVIPWARVLDVREVPWLRGTLSWYPRMWQVDLDRDQRFDFCGTRKAREIVIEYVKRSGT